MRAADRLLHEYAEQPDHGAPEGWPRSGQTGPWSVQMTPLLRHRQKGATAAIGVATVEDDGPNGRLFSDEAEIPW
nr:hypothetical protein [Streptomyces sp. SID9727]